MIASILPLLLLSFLPYASDACAWRFCSDINGVGPCVDYYAGEYASLGAHYKYYSSAYLVSGRNSECVALVYHNPNYGRFERILTHNTPNFHDIRFNDAMASVKIVSTYCAGAHFFSHNLPHTYSCSACPRGSSKAAGTCTIGGTCSNSVSQCYSCTPGDYSPSAGGGCLYCPVGTFQTGHGAHSCQSCPLGTYQNGRRTTACKLCEAGTKGLRTQATSYNDGCGSCPAGTFQRNRGQDHCDNCSPGSVSAEGYAECYICPAGTKADANAASCESCPAGSFQSQTGQTACELCPEGTFQPTNGGSSCIPCAAGEVSFPGSTECIPCPEGTFPDETSGSCQPCHDNLIGFEGKCYGTMDFRNCPYNSQVGECEFDSQDESFELLPGCQIAQLTHDVMTNIIFPEEHQFGAKNIRECPHLSSLNIIGDYAGVSLPNMRPLNFELTASISSWNLYLIFSHDDTSTTRNFAAALIIRNGYFFWSDIKNNAWGSSTANTPSSIQLDSTFTIAGTLYSTHVSLTINGVESEFTFRNGLSSNFFMVTNGWSVDSVSISCTSWNIEVGLCRATNSDEHGGFCTHNDKDSLEECQLDCSEAIGCAATGFYEGSWCDLFFHSASAPSTCPDGYTSYTGSTLSESYVGAPHTNYPNAQCAIKIQPDRCSPSMQVDQCWCTDQAFVCPVGWTRFGDGSACESSSGQKCDLGHCANAANPYPKCSDFRLVTSTTSPLESNITFTSSTFNVSNSTMAPSVAPTLKDDGKVLIECKVGNIVPSASPTANPSVEPTANPTFNPTSNPSEIPSQNPSVQPSFAPSLAPTFTEPSVSPTVAPTTSAPTNEPTAEPTANPTFNPTSSPSAFPTTSNPTVEPTAAPSFTAPTNVPSSTPTTSIPSSNPTTNNPTISPTNPPSAVEVVEVAESKDRRIFLLLLFVAVGCTICCIGCVYFKPIFVGKADSEENGKRTPGQTELGKPVSPLVDINDALDEMWTKPSVEIKIAE